MTTNPIVCGSMASIRLAAQLMADHDCAAIAVTESDRLIGIITDRDIACRGVAGARETVVDCMTKPVITVTPDDDIEIAVGIMEENKIHHLPVTLADGTLVGMLAQSDLGRRMTNREFGALARMTSIRAHASRGFVSALVRRDRNH